MGRPVTNFSKKSVRKRQLRAEKKAAVAAQEAVREFGFTSTVRYVAHRLF
jgi:hypothetical protein